MSTLGQAQIRRRIPGVVVPCRLVGVPLRVDLGLLLVAAGFVVGLTTVVLPQFSPDSSILTRVGASLAAVAGFVVSLVAHEVGHVLAARRSGLPVAEMHLSFYGGSVSIAGRAPSPRSEFWVAAAGPLTNLVFALLISLPAIWIAVASGRYGLTFGCLVWVVSINLLLATVNLIPALPLDGGRMLAAALWGRGRDADRATSTAAKVGVVFACIGGLVSIGIVRWWPFEAMLGLATAWFVSSGALGELRDSRVRFSLKHTQVGEVMVDAPTALSDSLTVRQALDTLGDGAMGQVTPLVRWDREPVGFVLPAKAMLLDESQQCWTRIDRLAVSNQDVLRSQPTEPVASLLERSGEGELMAVVHDPHTNRLLGTLGSSQVDALVRSVLPKGPSLRKVLARLGPRRSAK